MREKDEPPDSRWKRFIAKFRRPPDHAKVTEEMLSDLEQDGHIDHDESEMMQSILYLDDTTVREVMVPRTELTFVSVDFTLDQIIRSVLDSGHSRLPVIDGTIDKVVGFIHVKDLLRYWNREKEFKIAEVLRQPLLVPETKKLDDMLTEFQQRRERIALVIDEFGGTSGLVSIEDILEEIVGDIIDEYDKLQTHVFVATPDSLRVSGRFDMYELSRHFGIAEIEGNFNTVGGWIFDRIGRVPKKGETFEMDNFQTRIERASERQIHEVLIERLPPRENT